MAAVSVMFMMAFVVLFRYAAIAKEYSDLSKARAELDLINAKIVETRMAAEELYKLIKERRKNQRDSQ